MRQSDHLARDGINKMVLDLKRTIAGRSSSAQAIRERIISLSNISVPVIVFGESGTGRGHIIRILHNLSDESGRGLTVIGAGDSLSPLIRGREESIYLDSVDRFSSVAQSYWLERVASNHEWIRDRRIFASAMPGLDLMVREKKFNKALAAALCRFSITIPPLRDRIDDIGEMARSLAREAESDIGKRSVRITPPAISALRSYSWPGNVRELKMVMERLVAFTPDGRITRSRVESALQEMSVSITSYRRQNEERQRRELEILLEDTGGNLAEAARRLGLSRGAIVYRAKKFRLLPSGSSRR